MFQTMDFLRLISQLILNYIYFIVHHLPIFLCRPYFTFILVYFTPAHFEQMNTPLRAC